MREHAVKPLFEFTYKLYFEEEGAEITHTVFVWTLWRGSIFHAILILPNGNFGELQWTASGPTPDVPHLPDGRGECYWIHLDGEWCEVPKYMRPWLYGNELFTVQLNDGAMIGNFFEEDFTQQGGGIVKHMVRADGSTNSIHYAELTLSDGRTGEVRRCLHKAERK